MFFIWYGDNWDLSYKDYNSTPKILTGAPSPPALQLPPPQPMLSWPAQAGKALQAAHTEFAFLTFVGAWRAKTQGSSCQTLVLLLRVVPLPTETQALLQHRLAGQVPEARWDRGTHDQR